MTSAGWELGRRVFGASALAFGLVTFAWHDYNDWHQLKDIWDAPSGGVFVYLAAAAQVFGGAALLLGRLAKAGALVLGVTYLIFALLWVPKIVSAPQVYDSWGNFFEQFSLVTGAFIVYASLSPAWTPARVAQTGRVLFGICVASFTLEQALYLNGTAHFVPAWIPPNQMFWAVFTTVAFALAAVAILTNLMALLAARLTTAMIVLFGLLIWAPQLLAHPNDHVNWAGTAENFAIAGAAWILADVLGRKARCAAP
jgi:uncharacterized membrane protein YphA (DoxX/SURF4 family)